MMLLTRALFSLLVAVPVVGLAAPAQASCFGTARVSAHKFTGTVTATSNNGRTATVRTDDGKTVTVMGSEVTEPNAMTTVDRSFEAGTRYEFHPVNDTNPYRDNACTATHAAAGASADGGGGGAADQPGAPGSKISIVLPWLGAGVVVVAGMALRVRRRRVEHVGAV